MTTAAYNAIPAELKALDQWVTWRTESRDGKATKVPYNANPGSRARARSNAPSTWTDFSTAVARAAQGDMDGIGFEFGPDDEYAGVDLDDCRDPDTGELHEDAQRIVDDLDSYAEVSPSLTGLKIIVKAKKPGTRARTDATPWGGDIEMYDERRYFALTGDAVNGSEVRHAQASLNGLYARFFGRVDSVDSSEVTLPRAGVRKSYCKAVHTVQGDEGIVAELLARPTIAAIYNGEPDDLPSDSERDFALVSALLTLTRDRAQIIRVWKSSAVWRSKCERPDYTSTTIDNADKRLRSTGFASLGLQSDLGNADRLVAEHGDDTRYITGLGWAVWDGARWKPDADGEVRRRSAASARRLYEAIPNLDYNGDKTRLARFALLSTQDNAIEATMRSARAARALRVPNEAVDHVPGRLNVLNGTLNLKTGRLDPHDPHDLITKVAPVEWDEEALSVDWEDFVARALPDEELRSFVQRVAGYSIGGNPTDKVLAFLHGTRDTGKSTFLNAIATVLGDYAATANFESFIVKRNGHGTRNDLARLRGVYFVKSLEVEEGSSLAAGVLKSWTGGDTIAARFLYKEEFEFVPQGVLWLAANARPKVQADDDAMWRRILHVPFIVSIPDDEQDTDLARKLSEPAARSAILKWLVDGHAAYLDRGLDVPEVVKQYTDEYRHENNDLAGWWDDGFARIDKSEWTPWQSIKDSIQKWADESRTRCPNDATIRKALRAAGCADRKQGGVRGWDGVRTINDDNEGETWRT